MSTDREKARSMTSIIGTVVVALFILVAIALVWGSCHEPGSDDVETMVSPPPDGPGPGGAPGVAP